MYDPIVMLPVTRDFGDVEAMQKAKASIDNERGLPSNLSMWWWELTRGIKTKINRYIPIYAIRNVLFTPENRGNLVRIPTLGYEYSDPSHKLLHANFAILVDFIEKEEPFRIVDWDATPEHRHAADEMLELYRWWNVDPFAQDSTGPDGFYSMDGRAIFEYSRTIYSDEDNWIADVLEKSERKNLVWFDIERKADEIAEKQLIRLMKIRQYLWC